MKTYVTDIEIEQLLDYPTAYIGDMTWDELLTYLGIDQDRWELFCEGIKHEIV